MKWPLQKTRWSLVTRTRKRSEAMIRSGTPGESGRHLYATLPQGHEQGRRHQVGRRAGIAAVSVRPQPGIELLKRGPAGVGFGPPSVQHLPRPPARLLGHLPATFTSDQAIGVGGHQFELTENDR